MSTSAMKPPASKNLRDRAVRDLLGWYDANARDLPWRVPPQDGKRGVRPDPYRVWLSEVMLQQTTVAAVRRYYQEFTSRWPTVGDLASADDAAVMAAWAGLGYYARARNLLACARAVVADHGGNFPTSKAALLNLPGIGPYTAAAIAAIAFDQPETVVDGNVERVMARLFDIRDPLPGSKKALSDLAGDLTPQERSGDYAQAVMDLGATICTPRNPACGICPWQAHCLSRIQGDPAALPTRSPKKPKPVRTGAIYVAKRSDGAWLLETRPPSGLLGGMLGWPTTDWAETCPAPAPPADADWQDTGVEVRHTFTHFHLRLRVFRALLPEAAQVKCGSFVDAAGFSSSDLPTVMRKAFDLANSDGGWN